MRSKKAKKRARRQDRPRTGKIVLISKVASIEHRLAAIEGHLQEIALVTGAKKRSIVIGPYLHDDVDHDLFRRFLDGKPHRTPELASVMGTNRRQVLRILRRINRRVKRQEGVEPFHFDPATRTWQLQLEIVDRETLQ